MSTETFRVPLREIWAEAVAAVVDRPGRAMLTALGTVLGVGALVATIGLTETARQEVANDLNALIPTHVELEIPDGPSGEAIPLPWDAEERVMALNGVVSAGTLSQLDIREGRVRGVRVMDPQKPAGAALPVFAVSAGFFDVVDARLASGRYFDHGHDQRSDPVAVLGPAAAKALEITSAARQPTVFVDGRPLTVVGIIKEDGVRKQARVLRGILVPNRLAQREFQLAGPQLVQIATDLGAADQVAREAPTALNPKDPLLVQASVASDRAGLRARVDTELNSLALVLGLVSLSVGGLGIASSTFVSVIERTAEIGLRRAHGATAIHIAGQFLLESTILGCAGGAAGTCFGVLGIAVASVLRDWTPYLPLWVVVMAPLMGALTGLVAGIYPALRATLVSPVVALGRSGA